MKVTLVTGSKAHTLELARQLESRGMFHELIIGYPRFKLGPLTGIPPERVVTAPFFHAPMIALAKAGMANSAFLLTLEKLGNQNLDRLASMRLTGVDFLISMAGSGRISGPVIQRSGGKWVCDRGAAHLAWQKQVLDAEYDALGIPWQGISPEKVDREVEEYVGADRIFVPSDFVRRTFIDQGVDPGKVETHLLGVDLSAFKPVERPVNSIFTILGAGQMGVQKGLHVLRAAIKLIPNRVRVQWAGIPLPEARSIVADLENLCDFQVLGHQSIPALAELMGRADAFVLPSVQDGFGMVATQAMACGTPVILSDAAGASELIECGQNGLVFESRDSEALARQILRLYENPEEARTLGANGRKTVISMGGWDRYGDSICSSLQALIAE